MHLVGSAGAWQGGNRPFPRMKWCTPRGIRVLWFDQIPNEDGGIDRG